MGCIPDTNITTKNITACNGDDEDDEVGYFDLYFDMKEDENQQEKKHTLRKESLLTSSFNSNVDSQVNTKFYEPLSKYFQEDAHACEVSVTFHERQFNTACNEDDEVDKAGYFDLYFDMKVDVNHQCIERSVLSKEDAANNIYVNVYQLLQNERQKNSQLANGNRLSPDSYSVRDKTLKTAIPSRYRTSNSQYYTYKYAESEITIGACGSIESNKDKSITEEKSKTLKSNHFEDELAENLEHS
ncbi:unnamed protein product [Mytilus edulis]|uniref:Uncharacterized protein n=1 Tax=Mytilus edulis TaxID=6550 RepID=A0A8S3T5G1_MYTED|nr:unnamed protein product [Mytilus edulis]